MSADRAARRPLRERVERLADRAAKASAFRVRVAPIREPPVWLEDAGGKRVADLVGDKAPDNANFIAASREAVPALAAALLVAVEALERIAAFTNPATTAPEIAADALRRMEEC